MTRRLALLAMPAVFALLMSSAALATTISQGSDYSYSTTANRKTAICDEESDGRQAYVKYEAGNYDQGTVRDQDGSGGDCWQNASEVFTSIAYHRTCESINNWPDACSKWNNHN